MRLMKPRESHAAVLLPAADCVEYVQYINNGRERGLMPPPRVVDRMDPSYRHTYYKRGGVLHGAERADGHSGGAYCVFQN